MSPARRSVNPQQEALDLGLPEPAPNKSAPVKAASAKSATAEATKSKASQTKPAKVEVAQGEPVDSVPASRPVSATRAASTTRAQQGAKDAPLLSDEQLRTTAELTVRDLAAYARGALCRAFTQLGPAHLASGVGSESTHGQLGGGADLLIAQ